MTALVKVLVLYILSMAHVVQPQLSQAQPCLICGDAVLRIWSMMSRQGDKYLRITSNTNNNNHNIIDCGGVLPTDRITTLLKIIDRTTLQGTRVQFALERDSKQYHLYAPSADGELLAMPASEGEQQTDGRNTWAPERLLYEHRLFTVFQSIKFKGYYLSCDGSGKAVLTQLINTAYREPNQLFLTIDPGNAIRGVTFGNGNAVSRRKREITTQEDANPARRYRQQQHRHHIFWQTGGKHSYKHQYKFFYPKPLVTKMPPTTPPPKYSSVETSFDLPLNITFVLCFWIKTESKFAQLISITEKRLERTVKKPVQQAWKRWKVPSPPKQEKKDKRENIINVSIVHRMLRLKVGYQRMTITLSNCDIADGKFHQICISLDKQYLFQVYRDAEVIYTESMPSLAFDFRNNNGLTKRPGTLMLGRTRGMQGMSFDGSLFQVNLWAQYPSFRIKRIATNCACGGGSLVKWSDLLNGTMSDVNFDTNSECPKLEGYNYDEIMQNRLI